MNKKLVILESVTIGLFALVALFMFVPVWEGVSVFSLARGLAAEYDGYALLKTASTGVIALAFIGIALAVVTLLCSCGVIKSRGLAKALRIVNLVLVCIATLLAFILVSSWTIVFTDVSVEVTNPITSMCSLASLVFIANIVLIAITLKKAKKANQEVVAQ